jgi:hypothetical protein
MHTTKRLLALLVIILSMQSGANLYAQGFDARVYGDWRKIGTGIRLQIYPNRPLSVSFEGPTVSQFNVADGRFYPCNFKGGDICFQTSKFECVFQVSTAEGKLGLDYRDGLERVCREALAGEYRRVE